MQREEQGWMRPYLRSDAPKQAPIVEFDPAGKAWNTPIGEANKGSHKVRIFTELGRAKSVMHMAG
jgi:hypothetical protein